MTRKEKFALLLAIVVLAAALSIPYGVYLLVNSL